jgi:uncharacterized protein YqgV (UPF0045/DUF77 family)
MQSSKKSNSKGTGPDGPRDSGTIVGYREGASNNLAVGHGRMSPNQGWIVSYITRIEVTAETWFEAVEKAEHVTGLPREQLNVRMGYREGASNNLAVGHGRMSPNQGWIVSYITRIEVTAETWFEAVKKAEHVTGLPREQLNVRIK